jgi:hypothetical protein
MVLPRSKQDQNSASKRKRNQLLLLPLCILVVVAGFSLREQEEENNFQLKPSLLAVTKDPQQRPQYILSRLATSNNNDDKFKSKLLQRLSDTVEVCGPLCEINSIADMKPYMVPNIENRYFSQLQVPLDCDAILSSPLVDVSDASIPYPIPDELKPYYGMDGAVKLQMTMKHQDIYAGAKAKQPIWEEADVEQLMRDSEQGVLEGNYGRRTSAQIRAALERHGSLVGSRVLVIGSENPWMEAICLSLGAASVTTLEYGTIVSHHPRITTMIPSQMHEAHQKKMLQPFDLVAAFSSVEHSGLGRYGDGLNPWGDVLAMARAWCWTKDSHGKLLLGVPTGKDRVEFNGCRVYGINRWPLLSANWKLINQDQLVEWGEMEQGLNHSATFIQQLFTNSSYFQPSMMFEKVGL